MRTYQDNSIKVISGQADLITSTLWSVSIAMYYFSYFMGICICAEQTFTEASAKNKKFPEAFSIAMFAYTSTLLSVKMSTRRWEYQWMECMKWTHRIVTGSPSEISSRTIGLGFVCTLFPISQHALQQNVDFVGIGNRALWHPYLLSIALLIIVFMFLNCDMRSSFSRM